ncbi:MAG: peptidase M20 [Clostridiales bacterium]|nr:MAG: peptidase M20 [Clostridiales bacterium]
MNVKKAVQEIENDLIAFRRNMHMFPELSGEEYQTQKRIEAFLDERAIVHQRMAGTGVVATIGSGSPVIALRADIDALPIQEAIESDFKSKIDGVMHACGHDIHTAINLGVATLMKHFESELNGTVKCIFEPAEETYGGAKIMVEEGVLENPKVDAVLGLHIMPYLDAGKAEFRYGKLNASSDALKITVRGKRGHGAYPDSGVDALLISAHILTAIQSIVSRNTSPLNSVVVSFGTIEGGERPNVIAEKITMTGTLRALDQETRDKTKMLIKKIATEQATSFGGQAIVEIGDDYLPLVNDDKITRICLAVAEQTIGKENMQMKEFPSLGTESFSFFSECVPGMFYHLGTRKPGAPTTSLHDERLDPDESAIASGVELNVNMVLALMEELS